MSEEVPPLERSIERVFTRLWRMIVRVEKHLTTSPRNKWDFWDKRIQKLEIFSFLLLIIAIVYQIS